jgi:hypothetical protein
MTGPLTTRKADLSKSKPPEWAWQDRIALGALNLIVGNEGTGKGTLACWTLAQITRGQLPGDLHSTPATVAIIGDEDDFDDVWTPRLHAAGADLDRVELIERGDGSLIELAADRAHLAEVIVERRVKLLYLDALIDTLGSGTDDWRTKQVRDALAPARHIAREHECAVLGSLHPNKSGGTFRQLVSGSVAFNAVSRSSLLLAAHPDDEDRRVLVRGKGNLSALPDAIEFEIESHHFKANGHDFNVPRAMNFGTSKITSEDLLAGPSAPPPAGAARTDARELIAGWLEDGDWHPAGPIIAECKSEGIHARAAQRAADDIGIDKQKRGMPAKSYWRLTRQPEVTLLQPGAPVASVASADLALESRGDRVDRGASENGRHLCVTSGENGHGLEDLLDAFPGSELQLLDDRRGSA